jgi:hypothetical protein
MNTETPVHETGPRSWNNNPKPYVWTKTPDQILDRLAGYCSQSPPPNMTTLQTDRTLAGFGGEPHPPASPAIASNSKDTAWSPADEPVTSPVTLSDLGTTTLPDTSNTPLSAESGTHSSSMPS